MGPQFEISDLKYEQKFYIIEHIFGLKRCQELQNLNGFSSYISGTGIMELRMDRITLAVERIPEMVMFYNAVFNARLVPIGSSADVPFHRGKLAGTELLFCPNSIAQVDARHNRHQLRFVVDDLEAIIAQVTAAGGVSCDDIHANAQMKSAAVEDPDGNTIEFIQYLQVN